MSQTSYKKHPVHIYHMAPLVTISNDAMPGKYEKKLSKLSPWNFTAFMVRLKWDISVSFLRHIGDYFCVIRVSYHIG